MVIDDNRRSEFRNEVSVPDSAGYAEPPCADEVDAPDWPPIDDALPQLRAQQQAMIRPSYFYGGARLRLPTISTSRKAQ